MLMLILVIMLDGLHKVRKEMMKSGRYYVECNSGSLPPTSSLLKEKRTIF
jgi:hypothetical protein